MTQPQQPHQPTRPHYYRGFHNSDPGAQGYAAHCGCGWHSTWQRGGSLNELAAVVDYFEHRLDTADTLLMDAVCHLGFAGKPTGECAASMLAAPISAPKPSGQPDHVCLLSREFAQRVCFHWRGLDISPRRAQHVAKLQVAIAGAIVQAISDVTKEEMSGGGACGDGGSKP